MAEREGMEEQARDNTVVTVSEDNMSAFINVRPLTAGYRYTAEELKRILAAHKVVAGIKEDILHRIAEESIYEREILAAEGIPCKSGKDGYFEFFFNTVVDKKPKILQDGSVDYGSLGSIEVVNAGTVIVKYHGAQKGENGINVRGVTIYCKNGKELAPLKGKGFSLSEDRTVYTASISGKVEYSRGRLNVSNLLLIENDVTHATGNVEFSGDVVINGAVYTGMAIKAMGSVTVNGHLEGAEIIAGKDVILKAGMQGAGKGKIYAGGSVSGKFFELATIQCKKDLNTNALLNCNVKAEGEVVVSGKSGIIIGGSVSARMGIHATIIGNMAEVRTTLIVGTEKDLIPEIMGLTSKMEQLLRDIEKIKAGIGQINGLIEKNRNPRLKEQRVQLLRAKTDREAELSAAALQKEELLADYEKALGSRLTVRRSVFPRTKIIMSGAFLILEAENYNVTYQKMGLDIVAIPNI